MTKEIKYRNGTLTLEDGTTFHVSRWDLSPEQPHRIRLYDDRCSPPISTDLSFEASKAFIEQAESDEEKAAEQIRILDLLEESHRLIQRYRELRSR